MQQLKEIEFHRKYFVSDHSSDSFDSIRNIEFKTYALEDQAEMNPTPSLWQQQSNGIHFKF